MSSPRISSRKGETVRLNVTFYKNGVPADPFAIRRIDIYKNSKKAENLVAQVPIDTPETVGYPSPVVHLENSSGFITGEYYLDFDIPDTFEPDIYIDDWLFIGDELTVSSGSELDFDDETLWDSFCNKFWVFSGGGWYVDDGLIVPKFGFEALDREFVRPEIRTLEVGMMPLPLYDYDYNRIAPLIPQLTATISIETANKEVIIDGAACRIGLRQGSFRTNPFVVQYTIDTGTFIMGTYTYFITLTLPNGETRISKPLYFAII